MTVINHKSISGVTSITAPAGSDNLFTVHTNDTTERFRIDASGHQNISGIITASNFKTGTTNVHNVGVEAAGINVLGADTPIGTGATVYNSGLIVGKKGAEFQGVVTASAYHGDGSQLTNLPAQATISNNADNRVITGSGTANTLEGEASLTFDGTKATSPVVSASNGIIETAATISSNHTISTNYNGLSAGPVTVSATVTIPSGSVWTIV